MTDDQMIYGTMPRSERQAEAKKYADAHGINLREFAREAGLEYVLDAPEMKPLSLSEVKDRERQAGIGTSADMRVLPHREPIHEGLTSSRPYLESTSESGSEDTAMAAAFAKARNRKK
jgi:hypothetical protein